MCLCAYERRCVYTSQQGIKELVEIHLHPYTYTYGYALRVYISKGQDLLGHEIIFVDILWNELDVYGGRRRERGVLGRALKKNPETVCSRLRTPPVLPFLFPRYAASASFSQSEGAPHVPSSYPALSLSPPGGPPPQDLHKSEPQVLSGDLDEVEDKRFETNVPSWLKWQSLIPPSRNPIISSILFSSGWADCSADILKKSAHH